MHEPSQTRRRSALMVLTSALALLVVACKPGDSGGGTANQRSMASPASTPAPSRPEPLPGDAASGSAR